MHITYATDVRRRKTREAHVHGRAVEHACEEADMRANGGLGDGQDGVETCATRRRNGCQYCETADGRGGGDILGSSPRKRAVIWRNGSYVA